MQEENISDYAACLIKKKNDKRLKKLDSSKMLEKLFTHFLASVQISFRYDNISVTLLLSLLRETRSFGYNS